MVKLFNILLKEDEKELLQKIIIENNTDPFRKIEDRDGLKSFNDDPYQVIYSGLKDTSTKNSDDLCDKVSKIISKIIDGAKEKLRSHMDINKFKTLLWLRFRTPSELFNLPRWHIDGNYPIDGEKVSESTNQKKIIISLRL